MWNVIVKYKKRKITETCKIATWLWWEFYVLGSSIVEAAVNVAVLCTVRCIRMISVILCYLYFIIIFHILHFIFSYTVLINKCKRHLVILSHCQLYIKALLSYSLKMASWEPKHVAAMFFQLIIFYVIKLCWTIKLYISINHWKHNWMSHPKQSYSILFLKFNFRVI